MRCSSWALGQTKRIGYGWLSTRDSQLDLLADLITNRPAWHSPTIIPLCSRVAPTPRCKPQSHQNEHDESRSRYQEREPVSTLDGSIPLRATSLITNPSLYLDRAALHLNLRPYRSLRLTYRNYTARCSKSGIYAELV